MILVDFAQDDGDDFVLTDRQRQREFAVDTPGWLVISLVLGELNEQRHRRVHGASRHYGTQKLPLRIEVKDRHHDLLLCLLDNRTLQ